MILGVWKRAAFALPIGLCHSIRCSPTIIQSHPCRRFYHSNSRLLCAASSSRKAPTSSSKLPTNEEKKPRGRPKKSEPLLSDSAQPSKPVLSSASSAVTDSALLSSRRPRMRMPSFRKTKKKTKSAVDGEDSAKRLSDDILDHERDEEESLFRREEDDDARALFGKLDNLIDDEEMFELDDDHSTEQGVLRARKSRLASLDMDGEQDELSELPEGMSTLEEDDTTEEDDISATADALRAQMQRRGRKGRAEDDEVVSLKFEMFSAKGVFSPFEIQRILEDDDTLPDDVHDAIWKLEQERAAKEGRAWPEIRPVEEDSVSGAALTPKDKDSTVSDSEDAEGRATADPLFMLENKTDLSDAGLQLQRAIEFVRGVQLEVGGKVEEVFGRSWRVVFVEECERYIARRLTVPDSSALTDLQKIGQIQRVLEKAGSYVRNLREASKNINGKDHNPYYYGFMNIPFETKV
ncbi:putative mitochondrial protein [Andalucia godoyi]|uniref:Putative mitochondrial protein n=1 Tax=Andalucia godoyi TaxID=505711 RepID=A0A8K0AIC6_ANDGO|nr:putative mitochondrial protein [Andalucia godoyi]|eukprot:ANDGO_03342.mRNA.1 putative mitochondrial protein